MGLPPCKKSYQMKGFSPFLSISLLTFLASATSTSGSGQPPVPPHNISGPSSGHAAAPAKRNLKRRASASLENLKPMFVNGKPYVSSGTMNDPIVLDNDTASENPLPSIKPRGTKRQFKILDWSYSCPFTVPTAEPQVMTQIAETPSITSVPPPTTPMPAPAPRSRDPRVRPVPKGKPENDKPNQ